MVRILAACAIVALLAGCASSALPRVKVYESGNDASHPPTYAGMPIRSGQIILTEAPDPTSFVFMLIPDRFYYFTHAGIVVMEDGEPWVYEVAATFSKLPFHEKVLDNVSGEVMRRRLFEYVAPNLYAEILDPPPGVDAEKVAEFARRQYSQGTEFDPYFRWDEHERLFCTEFVELALRAGGAQPTEPIPALEQPSLLVSKQWLGVPLHEAMPAGLFYDPQRRTAAMGRFPSRGAAFAYFEAKRELYRRFSQPDQRMGYLFKLRRNGSVELRDDVYEFLTGVAHLSDDGRGASVWGDPQTASRVRDYADRFLGPAPD